VGNDGGAETKVIHYLFKGLQIARGRALLPRSGLQNLNTLFNVIRSLYVKHLFKTYNQTIARYTASLLSFSYSFWQIFFAG